MPSIKKSLRAIAVATLWLTGFTFATPVASNITLMGDIGNVTHVQHLYDSMDGNMFLNSTIFGEGAHISGLLLASNASFLGLLGNETFASGLNFAYGLDRRAAVKYDSASCPSPPTNGYRLFTDAQQLFLTSKFCSAVVATVPSDTALAGLVVSELACGDSLEYVCKAVFTISAAIAGTYLGDGIQKQCDAVYADILSSCGDKGGEVYAEIKSTGSWFEVVGYATTASRSCATTVSGGDCATYTCDGNCNPGNLLPTS